SAVAISPLLRPCPSCSQLLRLNNHCKSSSSWMPRVSSSSIPDKRNAASRARWPVPTAGFSNGQQRLPVVARPVIHLGQPGIRFSQRFQMIVAPPRAFALQFQVRVPVLWDPGYFLAGQLALEVDHDRAVLEGWMHAPDRCKDFWCPRRKLLRQRILADTPDHIGLRTRMTAVEHAAQF